MTEHDDIRILKERPEAEDVIRPWGALRKLVSNHKVTVNLIFVESNQRLSLQSHSNRAELWIVLDEGAIIEIGEKIFYPKTLEEIWIPVQTKHRLSSAGPNVRVLEIAFGHYELSDITRFADDFHRIDK